MLLMLNWILFNCALANPVASVPINNLPPVPDEPGVPDQLLIVNVNPAHETDELFANFNACAFDPKSIVEFEFRFKVEPSFIVLPEAILTVLSLPPSNLIGLFGVISAIGFNLSSPAEIVVAPVYEKLFVRRSEPVPDFVNEFVPVPPDKVHPI